MNDVLPPDAPQAAGGAANLMRRLCRPLRAASADELAALHRLRDDFGAAVETPAGWRTTYRPEWLQAARLREEIAAEVEILEETTSTSLAARQRTPPFFCFAEHQTAGRGRRGKQWLSLPGDALLFSTALPPPPSVAGLSVAIGAMLWKTLGGGRLRLKWPNDLLDLSGNKVGGVLSELTGDKLIVGVGLNLRMTSVLAARIAELDGGAHPAAGLNAAFSPPPSRHECAVRAAQALIETVSKFAAGGFAAFQSLAEQAHVCPVGGEMQGGGRFAGFDSDGALLLIDGGGGDGKTRRLVQPEQYHVAGG